MKSLKPKRLIKLSSEACKQDNCPGGAMCTNYEKDLPKYLETLKEIKPKLAICTPECVCIRPIINDERAFNLGYMCSKCGKNADRRIINYLVSLGKLTIKKSRRDYKRIKGMEK